MTVPSGIFRMGFRRSWRLGLGAAFLCLFWSGAFGQATLTDDAYTLRSEPNANLGHAAALQLSSTSSVYLKFDLSRLRAAGFTSATMARARLILSLASRPTAGSFLVCPIRDTWSETSITFDTAPEPPNPCSAKHSVEANWDNRLIITDVTPIVRQWLEANATTAALVVVA